MTSPDGSVSVGVTAGAPAGRQPYARARARERAKARLVTPERLSRLFAPRSIAVVGASDTSGWARNIITSLRTAGFGGSIVPVHPRHPSAFGIPTRPSLRDLDDPVDLAFVLTPTHTVEGVLDDAAVAGVHNAVVLAAGFGEQGEDGRALEDSLVDRAIEHDITLLGPNGLGFVNATTGAAPYGLVITPPLISGPVGVVLQSGALASAVLGFARARAIGLSLLVSMGNEAMITTADTIDHLIEDDATRVIALFLEGIRQPERFAALAGKALAAGKPIVALKVGRSPGGQRNALAHTGAVAGDDAVVDAVLRQLGVIRVGSLEELLVTAGLLAYGRPLTGRRMAVVTASGGACDIVADRAHEEGIEIPDFAPDTVQAVEGVLPDFANAQNPLDVTGFGLAHQRSGLTAAIDEALRAVSRDPNVDFVFYMGVTLLEAPPPDDLRTLLEARMRRVAALIEASPVPVVAVGNTCTDVSAYARTVLRDNNLHVLGGMELGLTAIGHALRWQERRLLPRPGTEASRGRAHPPTWVGEVAPGPWPETRARELLAEAGVPVVPGELARTADEAARAAARLGLPVALKLCSAQVTHKSDIGGVALGLTSVTQVRKAFARVRRAARAVPDAEVDGVLVTPMRTDGVELLAGVTVDPTFGPVLTVGLGGIWVEVLRDTALRVLPVGTSEVRRMLDELRGAPVLHGARGGRAVDVDRVAAAVVGLTEAALALGPSLSAVEVNPLWVDGDAVEALDALVVTNTVAGTATDPAAAAATGSYERGVSG